LPRAATLPAIVSSGGSSVAVRVPGHPVARALIQAVGGPIAAPSANLSGSVSATTADHVAAFLGDRIDFLLDGGPTSGGIESTVVDVRRSPPRLLRPGLVGMQALQSVLARLDEVVVGESAVPPTDPLPSPGMLTRHYAPRVPLELVADESAAESLIRLRRTQGLRIGFLRRAADAPRDAWKETPTDYGGEVVLPDTPTAYAAFLYAVLHHFGDGRVDGIIAVFPAADDDAWLAVRDRLQRAAAPPE
ncbi:MAG: L-threonylcarbamoyladenylate synthase, partial [Planctomycetia bacterium]